MEKIFASLPVQLPAAFKWSYAVNRVTDESVSREQSKLLAAWFLGPKAENAEWEEKMVLHILQDHFHWRRNYFPSDEILITQNLRRESMAWNDNLIQQISEMLAGFRRHFPTYSPR